MNSLLERYAEQIEGQLECLDRVVITGTLPGLCFAGGMTSFLYSRGIRIFDYTRFAQPLRDQICHNAERSATEAGLKIEYIRSKKNFRQEERIEAILQQRGTHPGLVHIFSVLEPCNTYKPWHDKRTHKNFLKPDSGKCLHYDFYFIDEKLGLCYLRVPTWCPFRLQFYFNGHGWLASRLERKSIGYEMWDNAFVHIDNWEAAQRLADSVNVKTLHRLLDHYAALYCPAWQSLKVAYHWSLMQCEHALDIVFRRGTDLEPVYEHLSRTAVHAVKADHVATFLGRPLHANYQAEIGNRYHTRIEGTCIRHQMGGKASLKMYDKFARILRIETTVNDVHFFKHYRRVEHRDGTTSYQQAPLRKTIYTLGVLMKLTRAANRRYLAFISQLEDPTVGVRQVHKIASPAYENGRSLRGFNLLSREDHELLLAIVRGEFNVNGMTNKALRSVLPRKTPWQVSRLLKRLRSHGMIKKIGHTYKYYLTRLGRQCILAALKLREFVVIPAFSKSAAA